MRAIFGGLLATLVLGCGAPTEPSKPELEEYLRLLKQIETPAGSGPVRMRGNVLMGFETNSIDLCTSLVGPCVEHQDIGACHLKWSDLASKSIGRSKDGMFFMELTGRVSTAIEGYGHMDAHLCQVQAEQVLSLRETGPSDPLGPALVRSPAPQSDPDPQKRR